MNRWIRRAVAPALALMCSVALAQAPAPKGADAGKSGVTLLVLCLISGYVAALASGSV